MENKILVAYASTNGSTQEIAGVVAETLRGHGLAVDLLPMRNVRTLNGYSAVVLGISIYMFHWHKDALHFLARHQKILAGCSATGCLATGGDATGGAPADGVPVTVFTGGPFSSGDEKEWQTVRSQVDQELARFAWFKPLSVEMVGGRFDPAKLRFPLNLIPALKMMPASDLRDWTAIRAWASSLVPLLQPALVQ